MIYLSNGCCFVEFSCQNFTSITKCLNHLWPVFHLCTLRKSQTSILQFLEAFLLRNHPKVTFLGQKLWLEKNWGGKKKKKKDSHLRFYLNSDCLRFQPTFIMESHELLQILPRNVSLLFATQPRPVLLTRVNYAQVTIYMRVTWNLVHNDVQYYRQSLYY